MHHFIMFPLRKNCLCLEVCGFLSQRFLRVYDVPKLLEDQHSIMNMTFIMPDSFDPRSLIFSLSFYFSVSDSFSINDSFLGSLTFLSEVSKLDNRHWKAE